VSDQEQLDEAIAELATCITVDDVRQLLLDADARGLPGHPWRCPVAVWLKRRLTGVNGHDGVISVNPERVAVLRKGPVDWQYTAAHTLPPATREFVQTFDDVRRLRRVDPVAAAPYLPLVLEVSIPWR
jgi:hypothetical protein